MLLVLLLVSAMAGGDPLTQILGEIPIVGRILEADSTASSAAKLPPEQVDVAGIKDLIRDGALSSAPCLWSAVLPDEQH